MLIGGPGSNIINATAGSNLIDSGGGRFLLLIVGDGPARAGFEAELPDAIFTGFLEGEMLARAYANMEVSPAQMYAPGIAILLTALAFNTLGESLRKALDPKLRIRSPR